MVAKWGAKAMESHDMPEPYTAPLSSRSARVRPTTHIGSRVKEAKRMLSLEKKAGTRLPWLPECLHTLNSKESRPNGEEKNLPREKRVADLEFAAFAINESTRIALVYLAAVDTAELLRKQLAARDAEVDELIGQVAWLRGKVQNLKG
jgi:hypothetical protein